MRALIGLVVVMWLAEAAAIGYGMRRRGFDAYAWTLVALVLGPISLIVAASMVLRPPAHDPTMLSPGRPGEGTVDVLVGVDGSPEAAAALSRAAGQLRPITRRLTAARVIAIDATPDDVRAAEDLLWAEAHRHRGRVGVVLLRGDPGPALLHYAVEHDYRLLVAGTKGAGRAKAVTGSVATWLAAGRGIPVLLVDDVRAPQSCDVLAAGHRCATIGA